MVFGPVYETCVANIICYKKLIWLTFMLKTVKNCKKLGKYYGYFTNNTNIVLKINLDISNVFRLLRTMDFV